LWVELWPFQQKPVVQDLEEASDSKLRLRAFYRTYFPFPGCVLEGLEFNHGSNTGKPLITIEKLIIRGCYFGILSRRLTRITAENMHVFIPPFGSGATFHTTPSKITIDEIVANGARRCQRLALSSGYGWNRFVKMVDRVHPRKGATLELPFPDGDPEL
jgi:hypothetical protein